jgi:hypothetical protein
VLVDLLFARRVVVVADVADVAHDVRPTMDDIIMTLIYLKLSQSSLSTRIHTTRDAVRVSIDAGTNNPVVRRWVVGVDVNRIERGRHCRRRNG